MTRPHPRITATLTALCLVATAVFLVAPGAGAAASRVLTITQASANPQVPFQTFDGNPPKVFDVNGDGILEIIAQNDNQYVYVFDSQTGAILSQLKTTFPAVWDARTFNGPEVALMQEGGAVKMVLVNSAAYVSLYRYDHPGSSPTAFKWIKEWERRLTECHSNPGSDSKPTLHDLDKDGHLDIIATTEEVGTYALRSDGTLGWKNCMSGGNAEAAVADLNRDGWADVVHVSDNGIVSALNGLSGQWLWSFNLLKSYNLGSASIPVGAGIGQLDGIGGPDVVIGARDSHNATDQTQNHAMLLALDHAGKLLWSRQDPVGNPLTYTHPIVADADEDGTNEVYWGDWNTVGHKPPFVEADKWKRTGPANYYRYDHQGNRVWKQTLDTFWSNKDLVLANVDADPAQEVLADGPNANGQDGIWTLDSATGATKTHLTTYPYKSQRGPIVADLYNRGTTQMVLEVAAQAEGGGNGVLVYDLDAPYDSLWPHLPYPVVGPMPPPPPGSFDALFTVKSPGDWWQELTVKPTTTRTITKADIRINGGFWIPMAKSSWGAWTSSHNTRAGTRVEFRAADSGGFVSQSLPFTWKDGVLQRASTTPDPTPTTTTSGGPVSPTPTTSVPPPTTSTSPPPPSTTTTVPPVTTTPTTTPSAFQATFTPTSGINEWWVEVKVAANQPLGSVDARVNHGAWNALEYKSWGAWAKSIHAPKGSAVEFRAISSSTNSVYVSPTFWWMTGTDPGFSVTFTPAAVGNDWWIEVQASSTKTLASVEASINGGEWKPLTYQSWKNWAKSYYAPNGSEVRFRATSTTGETATSGTTVWT